MNKLKFLKNVINTGEVIKICYNGGSNPGSEREIVPLKIKDNYYLQAYCNIDKIEKTFIIDKIEMVKNKEIEYTDNQVQINAPNGIWKDVWNMYKDKWVNIDVYFKFSEHSIELFKKKKNKQPRTYPTVIISYEERGYTQIGNVVIPKEPEMLYIINGTGIAECTTKDIDIAAIVFFSYCEKVIFDKINNYDKFKKAIERCEYNRYEGINRDLAGLTPLILPEQTSELKENQFTLSQETQLQSNYKLSSLVRFLLIAANINIGLFIMFFGIGFIAFMFEGEFGTAIFALVCSTPFFFLFRFIERKRKEKI
jgi:hypothetical protein